MLNMAIQETCIKFICPVPKGLKVFKSKIWTETATRLAFRFQRVPLR